MEIVQWEVCVVFRLSMRLRYRDRGFLPGAFGFPKRSDFSFAIRTRSSNSVFETLRIFRMALLKCRNSGDASNCSAVSGGGSSVSPAPAALVLGRSAMLFRSLLPGEFLVGQPVSDYMIS